MKSIAPPLTMLAPRHPREWCGKDAYKSKFPMMLPKNCKRTQITNIQGTFREQEQTSSDAPQELQAHTDYKHSGNIQGTRANFQ
jgi:hypothetical protein